MQFYHRKHHQFSNNFDECSFRRDSDSAGVSDYSWLEFMWKYLANGKMFKSNIHNEWFLYCGKHTGGRDFLNFGKAPTLKTKLTHKYIYRNKSIAQNLCFKMDSNRNRTGSLKYKGQSRFSAHIRTIYELHVNLHIILITFSNNRWISIHRSKSNMTRQLSKHQINNTIVFIYLKICGQTSNEIIRTILMYSIYICYENSVFVSYRIAMQNQKETKDNSQAGQFN